MYKSVLVTGASSGIGEATALALAHRGFRVFAGARRIDKLKALEGLGHGRLTALALDVTDAASISAAVTAIGDAPLYGLVNNAGVSVTGPLEQVPVEDWRRQFETNVFGVVAATQAVLPQMRAAGEGRIVMIGSVAGRIASPFMSAYAASKHALEGLADSLRREVNKRGVFVSLIRPGFINTPFGEPEQEGFARYAAEGAPYAKELAAFKAWHAKGHPNGAPPSAVADAVLNALTAARPRSRYVVPGKMFGALALRNLAPTALTDRIFERITGLDRF